MRLPPILEFFARPVLLFYSLIALMVLLVAGTLAQAEIGLYQAEKLYFSSFILWWGNVPLPAGYTLMGIVALNLTAKMILKTEWTWTKAGINITHAGVMVLMVGALLTAITAREGYIIIPQEASNSIVSDYHARELVFESDVGEVVRVPFYDLSVGQIITVGEHRFTIAGLCRHCGLTPDGALSPLPLQLADEENVAGVTLHYGEAVMHSYETMPEPPVAGGHRIIVQREQYTLPFTLHLNRFDRVMHPGTRLPEQYTSHIEVEEDGVRWPAIISMNAPLRHGGYTFYQSSYLNVGGREATVLSVVKNHGLWFPYIATGIIALGLLLHSLLRVTR